MRVIAGKYKGTTLARFSGDAVRPTSDRVKESLFQILEESLVGARVLDLFCGSGALGIESLSRGAREVHFNDVSKESLKILNKNMSRVRESCNVTNDDFRDCLRRLNAKFDLIFSDPPYREDFLPEILKLVQERDLLQSGGWILHESEREEALPSGWRAARIKRYGRTYLYFLEKEE